MKTPFSDLFSQIDLLSVGFSVGLCTVGCNQSVLALI